MWGVQPTEVRHDGSVRIRRTRPQADAQGGEGMNVDAIRELLSDWIDCKFSLGHEFSGDMTTTAEEVVREAHVRAAQIGLTWDDDIIPEDRREELNRYREDADEWRLLLCDRHLEVLTDGELVAEGEQTVLTARSGGLDAAWACSCGEFSRQRFGTLAACESSARAHRHTHKAT